MNADERSGFPPDDTAPALADALRPADPLTLDGIERDCPCGEPVIDIGYMSLPAELQQAIEQGSPRVGEHYDTIIRALEFAAANAGTEEQAAAYELVLAACRESDEQAATYEPASSPPGQVTVSREDLQVVRKFLVCYVPLDYRGADWAAVERICAAAGVEG